MVGMLAVPLLPQTPLTGQCGWPAPLTAEGCDRVRAVPGSRCLPLPQRLGHRTASGASHPGHHVRAVRGVAPAWWGPWRPRHLTYGHATGLCGGAPACTRDRPVALLCSQCLPQLLLQYGTSASRPTDGSADEGVLWGSDRTNPPVESKVVSVLRHPAPSDVAHERPGSRVPGQPVSK